jgi:hypothetical protein
VSATLPASAQSLATYDDRPYFARALDFGLKNGLIDSEKLDAMRTEGAKGVVQIADFFGTAHLRTDLDEAVKRMVYLASLYLEHISDGSLPRAARSLQENSFLSHSRGGSQLLKALFAMPTDSTIHEPADDHDVREFLRVRTLGDQWSVAEFRVRLAERRACAEEIEAALWFADVMELPREALFGEHAESILDACLLTRVAGRMEGGLLSAHELKEFIRKYRRVRNKPAVSEELLEDMPDPHRAVGERHLKRIVSRDLPRIADMKIAFDDLVREYHDRFHHLSLSTDVSDYDTLVTDEWRKVTKGMTDTDSMNTVFLCLAAGKPPKPAISVTEAKAAIRAIRKGGAADGAAVGGVPEFIRRCAPHQMIDGLISLWEDEFFPEMIEQLILEESDDHLEPVLRILAEHCHIKAPARKR